LYITACLLCLDRSAEYDDVDDGARTEERPADESGPTVVATSIRAAGPTRPAGPTRAAGPTESSTSMRESNETKIRSLSKSSKAVHPATESSEYNAPRANNQTERNETSQAGNDQENSITTTNSVHGGNRSKKGKAREQSAAITTVTSTSTSPTKRAAPQIPSTQIPTTQTTTGILKRPVQEALVTRTLATVPPRPGRNLRTEVLNPPATPVTRTLATVPHRPERNPLTEISNPPAAPTTQTPASLPNRPDRNETSPQWNDLETKVATHNILEESRRPKRESTQRKATTPRAASSRIPVTEPATLQNPATQTLVTHPAPAIPLQQTETPTPVAVPTHSERNENSAPWNDLNTNITLDNILEGDSRRAKREATERIAATTTASSSRIPATETPTPQNPATQTLATHTLAIHAATEISDLLVISAPSEETAVRQTPSSVPNRPERNETGPRWNDLETRISTDNILEGESRRGKGKAKETDI
jgi:hypothetical protein